MRGLPLECSLQQARKWMVKMALVVDDGLSPFFGKEKMKEKEIPFTVCLSLSKGCVWMAANARLTQG
jgi:hypothetical protein